MSIRAVSIYFAYHFAKFLQSIFFSLFSFVLFVPSFPFLVSPLLFSFSFFFSFLLAPSIFLLLSFICFPLLLHSILCIVMLGLWNYEGKKEGSRIYKSLLPNTSKEEMSYSDFPMPKEYPNFMPHTKYLEYFRKYAKQLSVSLCLEIVLRSKTDTLYCIALYFVAYLSPSQEKAIKAL